MLRKSVEGAGGFKCDHPRLAVVVTCHARGVDNSLTVTWHSPLSEQPPLFGIALRPRRLPYELILEAKEFAVNFLPFESSELVAALGGLSGRQGDKFQRLHLSREKGLKTSAPLIHEAYAAYECVLQEHRAYGDHDLLVGLVVASYIGDTLLKDDSLDIARVAPALYLSEERYATIDKLSVRHLPRGESARRLQL